MTNEEMHTRLVHLLTSLDRRETAAEVRKRYVPNVYRLGHYLVAAGCFSEELEAGHTAAEAFRRNFTPCRQMHRIARTLGLPLAVARGRWVITTQEMGT